MGGIRRLLTLGIFDAIGGEKPRTSYRQPVPVSPSSLVQCRREDCGGLARTSSPTPMCRGTKEKPHVETRMRKVPDRGQRAHRGLVVNNVVQR
jgi:hypothetical protein